MLTMAGCAPQEGPTGYKAGSGGPGDSYIVETCDEEEFLGSWWTIETNNVIANTLVPAYKDYCTYVEEDYVFFWNTIEQYGFYNYDFYWKHKDKIDKLKNMWNWDRDEKEKEDVTIAKDSIVALKDDKWVNDTDMASLSEGDLWDIDMDPWF